MMKLVIYIGLALLLISCQGTSNMETYTYLALGDSYTIGESVPAESSFPYQLYERLKSNGINVEKPVIIARTGWTTDELQSAIDPEALAAPYDLVTLLIGVNNQYRGRDINNYDIEFTELLQLAIDLAGGESGHVIVISIPDWGVTPFAASRDSEKIEQEIDQYNDINREETQKRGILYVDITPISRQARQNLSLIAEDGLHPSGKMYTAWVELALPGIKTILNQIKNEN